MKQRTFCRILALVLALSVLGASCANDSGAPQAAAMHLTRAEGTVAVSDAAGKDIPAAENLGLYSGYQVATQSSSYAWVDLDSTKLTKLDQNSQAEVRADGRLLELEVLSGSLFFNVTQPLAEDESLSIRTSSIVVGVRGTCGWVKVTGENSMEVYLLRGSVECAARAPDGYDLTTVLAPGEMARITCYSDADPDIEVSAFTRADVPQFVLDELDEELLAGLFDGGEPPEPSGGPEGTDQPVDLGAVMDSLRENAVYYGGDLLIYDFNNGAPERYQPEAATGFINGVFQDLDGDGIEELIVVSSDMATSVKVEVYESSGRSRELATGSFYGSAEYGGSNSTLDIFLFRNSVLDQWCVAFCNTINEEWFHVFSGSLYNCANANLVDSWYWDDVSDQDGTELAGLETEMTAAGWPYLQTDFLSIQDAAAMDTCVWLSRATVTKDGDRNYLHIYGPGDLAQLP